MKNITLALFIVAIANSAVIVSASSPADEDPIQIVQDFFDGLWETVNLPDPAGLAASCFDESTAQGLVNTVNQTLQYLVQNNVLKAIQTCNTFYSGVSPQMKACINTNSSSIQMYDAIGLGGLTIQQADSRIMGYVLSHLPQVKQEIVATNGDFQAGNYVQTGKDAGTFMLQVFQQNYFNLSEFLGENGEPHKNF